MYFSYVPFFYLFAAKRSLNHFEQSAVPHEPREYHDPSGELRSVPTTMQIIDRPMCSSLPQFVLMHLSKLMLGPHCSSRLLKRSLY